MTHLSTNDTTDMISFGKLIAKILTLDEESCNIYDSDSNDKLIFGCLHNECTILSLTEHSYNPVVTKINFGFKNDLLLGLLLSINILKEKSTPTITNLQENDDSFCIKKFEFLVNVDEFKGKTAKELIELCIPLSNLIKCFMISAAFIEQKHKVEIINLELSKIRSALKNAFKVVMLYSNMTSIKISTCDIKNITFGNIFQIEIIPLNTEENYFDILSFKSFLILLKKKLILLRDNTLISNIKLISYIDHKFIDLMDENNLNDLKLNYKNGCLKIIMNV